MSLFNRRPRITPEYVTPLAESPVQPVDERRIAQLDAATGEALRAGDQARADRLLDMRNAIRPPRSVPQVRPSVPVIPGH